MWKSSYYYRLHLSIWQEAERTIEKSVGPVYLNIQRFSAGHSSWLCNWFVPGSQAGSRSEHCWRNSMLFQLITNKIQAEVWHRSQGQLRPCTELYSLGYYRLGKSESVRTSSGANANSFGRREGSIKTDDTVYSLAFQVKWMEVLL